jgi:hypothetical protein
VKNNKFIKEFAFKCLDITLLFLIYLKFLNLSSTENGFKFHYLIFEFSTELEFVLFMSHINRMNNKS